MFKCKEKCQKGAHQVNSGRDYPGKWAETAQMRMCVHVWEFFILYSSILFVFFSRSIFL